MNDDSPTHVFCELCGSIEPAIIEPLDAADYEHTYLGGDIVCGTCKAVLLTLYKEQPT